MDWSAQNIVELGLLLAVAGFLWSLHRDVRGLDRDLRSLSDRVARVEGLLEGLRDSIAGFQGKAGPPGWLPACRMQGTLEKLGTRERRWHGPPN